jgi:hypothetical protein
MKKGTDMMIASGVLMCALIWVLFNSIQPTGYTVAAVQNEKMESFMNCVYDGGATLYVNDGCEDCEKQKAVFGGSFDGLKYVECENVCERSDVTRFPTWIINGEKYEGSLSLEQVSALTGCKL